MIEQAEIDMPRIKIRYLVSINRTDTDVESIRDTLKTVKELASPYIAGVELSGDPRKGSFSNLKEILTQARDEYGLKISLHCAETKDQIPESQEMIDFRPDRLGHCCYLVSSSL